MNNLWKQQSAPWAIATVKNVITLFLRSEASSRGTRPSAATTSLSNILSRNPSANNSVSISHQKNAAHLEPQQQWRNWLRWFWGDCSVRFYRLGHFPVRQWSQYWIFCPETPLKIRLFAWISHENTEKYLELQQLWKIGPRCFLCCRLHHLVYVQVRQGSQCQITCPETPLQTFQ